MRLQYSMLFIENRLIVFFGWSAPNAQIASNATTSGPSPKRLREIFQGSSRGQDIAT